MDFFQQFKDLGSQLVTKTLLLEEKRRLEVKYAFPSSVARAKEHRKAARVKSTISHENSKINT